MGTSGLGTRISMTKNATSITSARPNHTSVEGSVQCALSV